MVLDTFTREELISTFLKVVPIFKKRAVNYTEHNVNDLFKKIKDGVYYKCFTSYISYIKFSISLGFNLDRIYMSSFSFYIITYV